MIEVTIPFKTPTINQMYATFRGHRIKSKEARQLGKEVKEIVYNQPFKKIEGELQVTIDIYSNYYNKNGTIKRKDIANYEKFITDSVFENLEDMDDKQIFKIIMNKIHSVQEKAIIKIEELK